MVLLNYCMATIAHQYHDMRQNDAAQVHCTWFFIDIPHESSSNIGLMSSPGTIPVIDIVSFLCFLHCLNSRSIKAVRASVFCC